jgi:SNF2-related domain
MTGLFHRFNLPTLHSALPNEQTTHVMSKLHGILKPFLLRRLKVDVEHSLPPKKEYVLYAPLSEMQREIYDAVLAGVLRSFLINGKQDEHAKKGQKQEIEGRRLRNRRKVSYKVDEDDEDGEFDAQGAHEEQLALGRKFQYKHAGVYSFSIMVGHVYEPCARVGSQAGQFVEIAEHGYAATQSVLPPIPFRLAIGSGYSGACHQ